MAGFAGDMASIMVPGNMNSKKTVRLVGSYEGAGYLERPLFGILFRFPTRTCGAFPGGTRGLPRP
jgi:hypothetical protein